MEDKLVKPLKILAAVAILFLVLAYGHKLASLLTPILLAGLLAMLLLPLIDWLASKIRYRLAASLCVMLPAFGLLFWGLWWSISRLYTEAQRFVLSFPKIFLSIQTLINERILPAVRGTKYEDAVFAILDNVVLQGMSWLQSFAKSLISSSITFVSSLPGLFLAFMVAVLLVFFLVNDKKWLFNLIPSAGDNFDQVMKSIYGYLRSQFVLIVVTAAICMLAFSLLGIPYVLVLGLAIAIFDLLPILGAGTLLVPMIAGYFIWGNTFTAIMLSVLYGVILVARQVVEPKLLSSNLDIHPVVAILSIYLGFKLFGPLGLILLPLTVSIAASFPKFKKLRR